MKIKPTEQMKNINAFFKDIKFYYVGGCVRDLINNTEPHDYDLITPLTPEQIEQYCKGKAKVLRTGKRFGTIAVMIGGQLTEITTYRKEIYDFQSRKPVVSYTTHLQTDLSRRDFTINTLVCNPNGVVLDYLNGIEDFNNRKLKCVNIPKITFKEDPLRILRAIRFAGKYDLEIDDKLKIKIKHLKFELYRLSKERIIEEINKMFVLNQTQLNRCMLLMFECDLWIPIIPELQLQYNYNQNSKYHGFKLHEHTLNVLFDTRADTNNTDMLWSALLHDIGKPFVRTTHKSGEYCNYIDHDIVGCEIAHTFLVKYKFPNKSITFITKTISEHLKDECWLRKYDDMRKVYKELASGRNL